MTSGIRLNQIIEAAGVQHGAVVIEVEVIRDHVHLLIEIPPAVALSTFVGAVKGRSSRLLRMEFPQEFGWLAAGSSSIQQGVWSATTM